MEIQFYSFRYSGMNLEEKRSFEEFWLKKWNIFIENELEFINKKESIVNKSEL